MKGFLLNIIDAIWIRKQAREQPLLVSPSTGKVHPIHHLLHLGYGSLVLALSVAAHVMITNHIKSRRTVWWTGGQIETNYSPSFTAPTHPVKIELGVMDDATAVYRITQ